jgi:hypothetical protein
MIDKIYNELYEINPKGFVTIAQLFIERMENEDIDLIREEVKIIESMKASDKLLPSQIMEHIGMSLDLAKVQSIDKLCEILTKGGLKGLAQVAKSKLLISSYAKLVFDFLNNSEEVEQEFPPIPNLYSKALSAIVEAQLYFLISLTHYGGKSSILRYLRNKSVPVIPPNATLIDHTEPIVKSIDPFSSLGGRPLYMAACAVVVQISQNNNFEALDNWNKEALKTLKEWSERMDIFLAAVFTQISTNLYELSSDVVQKIVDWVNHDYITSNKNNDIILGLYIDMIRYYSSKLCRQRIAASLSESMQQNLRMQIRIIAMSHKTGWLHSLLVDPKSLVKTFVPSMADSEMALILNVVDARGEITHEVGWYECPNGHKYSVGNCTRPMQVATCPDCKADIGGHDHVAVAGTKRLGTDSELKVSLPGYMLDVTGAITGYDIVRLGKLTTAIIRYLIHTVMLTNTELYHSSLNSEIQMTTIRSVASELMYPNVNRSELSSDRIWNELNDRLTSDWNQIKTIVEMDDEDIATGFHLLLSAIRGSDNKFTDDESKFGETKTDEEIARELDMRQRNMKPNERIKTLIMPPANMSVQARLSYII